MSELAVPADGTTVTRWRRYGHDRLYVRDAAGGDLGYWDLKTDEVRPAEERWRDAVTAAAVAWRLGDTPTPAPPPAALPPEPPAPVLERAWLDLATNRPGASVRETAEAAYAAAPVRSTLGRLLGVRTEETAWRLGAKGEEKVGAQLTKLERRDPRWRSLHAIPIGTRGSDIDHLVIGPGGVFTVNAKHHPGKKIWVGGSTFLVDGFRQPYVRNARFEAARAADLLSRACGLSVAVHGLVVPVNAAEVVVRSQPTDVDVVPRRQLAGWLRRLGPSLDDDQVAMVYDAARRSTTWR
ncbi:nuclease-related domain-containing protein [Nocardioides aequoreus]|uniref:nuclease-related domain-containing protein n=1 Tax=Nocardioides aequoreus TaxID=397278 RepID=UPI00068BFFED|nr:nuclease-related domain-containing protein [Nocardioides aequoreus]